MSKKVVFGGPAFIQPIRAI